MTTQAGSDQFHAAVARTVARVNALPARRRRGAFAVLAQILDLFTETTNHAATRPGRDHQK